MFEDSYVTRPSSYQVIPVKMTKNIPPKDSQNRYQNFQLRLQINGLTILQNITGIWEKEEIGFGEVKQYMT